MRELHLQARRLIGPLSQPRSNETRLSQSDDWVAVRAEADALARDGFTVWVFRYGLQQAPALATHGLRLVLTIQPVRDPTPQQT